jgi:D-glycero-D-manno-heptose 1,7-bisphosphate phosphatase
VPAPGLRAVTTVFLDRDGTINVRPADGEYITSPADLVLLPGAGRAVAELNAAGLRTVLVTNQRWLSRSSGDPACYAAVHARLMQLLAAEGASLSAAYHCPHAIGACDCRKPQPGMLRRAAREHRFELGKAVIVGDSDGDLRAGRAAGTSTILLRPSGREDPAAAHADAITSDLPAAVRLILQARRAAG